VTLDPAGSYGPGSLAYVSEHNFFLVRLADGRFVALADLDAANRANGQRRCRVAPLAATNASLPGLLSQYGGKFSAEAAGASTVLREDCNAAVYDIAGARLDASAPNLDRYPVAVDASGRVTVDLSRRMCTEREGTEGFAVVACAK
jgi:hypothetical protein